MKISVITPSFNQAQFLPFNLASVSDQRQVDVEHIVVDPGSTDGSTQIARQAPGVTLIAEPDRGQSDGICKGFARSTGDILVWLNSDDFYPDQDVLASVLRCFEENPSVDIVYGDVNFVGESGEFLRKGFVNKNADQLLASFEYQVGIVQPGVFWRRRIFEEIGGPSEEFEYCMDYELWVRMAARGYKWKYLPRVLAHHRWWGGMKTSSRRDLSLKEHFRVCERYFGYVHWKWLDRYADYLRTRQDGVVNQAGAVPEEERLPWVRHAIDEVVTQQMLYLLEKSTDPERVATDAFIKENHKEKKRVFFGPEELAIASENAGDPNAWARAAWHVFEATSAAGKRYSAYHVAANFDRYFDRAWREHQLDRTRGALARLDRERGSDTCVIVGNGPSLKKSDLSMLAGVDTIVSNFAIMSPALERHAKFLTVVNDLVARQGAIDFNASPLIKVVPFWLGNYFNEGENTYFVDATVRPEFGKEFVDAASWRSTVSFFNMQLAYAVGYRKVVLIGFDHSYIQPAGVVEGVVINQAQDDENHFDPKYFKGKDWQAADTGNMEKMYALARAAFEEDGREIVNCTVGGKLEVFRRAKLDRELENSAGRRAAPPMEAGACQDHPRLLIVAGTPIGHDSATGRLKENFIGAWPGESLLQVWESGGPSGSLHVLEIGQPIEHSKHQPMAVDDLLARCREFKPQVIYFNPTDSRSLLDIAGKLIEETNAALVVHMMDDWPARLEADSSEFIYCDQALRRLINRSRKCLSISDAMSEAYRKRYGVDWSALANGVELDRFPVKRTREGPPSAEQPFVIRYMGALADDMTYASVSDIARTVASLQQSHSVRFEIYTMHWCKAKAEQDLGGLAGVVVSDLVEPHRYERSLSEADALVIAYNFDEKSIRYIGYSLANKMPECLASGTPVLAYGPPGVATIDYLENAGIAEVVHARSQQLLRDAITRLIADADYGRQLAERARAFASANLTKAEVQRKFKEIVMKANFSNSSDATLIGPYERNDAAHYDETNCIAALFSKSLSGSTMIDVGAHHGWALSPFLEMGWKIYAFEPDNDNRKKLMERLSTMKSAANVKVDKRAVSDVSRSGLAFFRSDESTGISGLSAFHPTHESVQTVDTTTLEEVLADEDITGIDFLKIDTEGHDLFVLKGFPWQRFSPAVIECEFEDSKTVPLGYRFNDLADFLVEKGYVVYVSEWHPVIRYGIRHNWMRLARYPSGLASEKSWGNLMAFREPIDEGELVEAVEKVLSKGPPAVAATSAPAEAPAPTAPLPAPASVPAHAVVAASPTPRHLVAPSRHFSRVVGNIWRYTAPTTDDQKLWLAIFEDMGPTAGRAFAAGIRIKSNQDMTVGISLARHGESGYEGVGRQVALAAGVEQHIQICKAFHSQHPALKVQVEVVKPPVGGTAELMMDSIYLVETPSSVRQRLADKDLTLSAANRMFREKDYAAALTINLLLQEQRPLRMYAENARMAAQKLGLRSTAVVEKLMQSCG